MNGLGLDDWLEKTITNAAATGTPVIKLGVDLPGVTLLPGEDPGTQNPHLWMDVKYGELYVDRIAAALKQADPADAAGFDSRRRRRTRPASTRSTRRSGPRIATIPEANRKLVDVPRRVPVLRPRVRHHDRRRRRRGARPGSQRRHTPPQLIDAIKASGVKAIFSESQFPTKLVDQLAAETGTKVVANLYDDSVGDPPVDSYEAVINWDVDQLVTALH